MSKTLLSKKSFIPALYFKLIDLDESRNTYSTYMVALCPGYFGHFLIVNKSVQVPPRTTMVFYGYATSDTDVSTIIPYTLDTPNSALIGRHVAVTIDGVLGIRKDFKFVSVMRRRVNPEKWGIEIEEDPLSEIEDLNIKLSQGPRQPKFKVGEKVKIDPMGPFAGPWTNSQWKLNLDKVYTVDSISNYFNDVYYITLGVPTDAGGWAETGFIAVDEDPLSEIEDLNMRLSRDKFEEGDKIVLDPTHKYFAINERYGLEPDRVYTVKEVNGSGVCIDPPVVSISSSANTHWLVGRFKLADLDPLSEIEDLNIRLSQNENMFKPGDRFRLTDKYVGEFSSFDRCEGIVDRVEGDRVYSRHWFFHYRDGHEETDTIDGYEELKNLELMTPADPLAEIEDLNVRLSRSKFEVGDIVKCVGHGKVGWDRCDWITEGKVVVGETYKVTRVHEPEDSEGLHGMNGDAIKIESLSEDPFHYYGWWFHTDHFQKVIEDPLAEIEDLNVRLSSNRQAEDFTCVMLEIDKQDSIYDKIKGIAKKIKKEDLSEDGREDALHITLKYGLDTEDPDMLRPLLDSEGKIKVKIEKLDYFDGSETNQDFDVVIIRVDSDQIQKLHETITDTLKDSGETHDKYKAHITLAYVKKGLGKQYAKELKEEIEDLIGKEIVFKQVTFSNSDEKKTKIELSRHSSVIDHPKEHLDPLVWDGDKNIKETVKQEIILGLEQVGVPYKHVYVVGSIATLRWREDSDIDVTVLPDLREDDIKSLTKSVLKINGDETVSEHPINYYIREDLSPDNYSAVYNLLTDEWVKEEDTNVSVLDDVIDEVRTWARKIASDVEDYHMDVTDLGILNSSLTERGVNKEKLGFRIDTKLKQIDDDIDIITSDYDVIHQRRRNDFERKLTKGDTISKEYLPSNLIYKYLERYGLIGILQSIRKIGKDRDETKTQLSRHIKSLLESKLPTLIKQYPDKTPEEAQERIRMLNQADPTGEYGEYTPWIVRLDVNKTSRFPEDIEITKELLILFEGLKLHKKPIEKDIFKYNTFSDLSNAVTPFVDGDNVNSRETLQTAGDTSKSEVIYQNATYKVIELLDPFETAKLCKGASWCVKDDYTAQEYLSRGRLFLVYKNGKKYVLVHKNNGEEISDLEFDEGPGEARDVHNAEITHEMFDELEPILGDAMPEKYYLKYTIYEEEDIDEKMKDSDSGYVEDPLFYRYQKLSLGQIDYVFSKLNDEDVEGHERTQDEYTFPGILSNILHYQKLNTSQIDKVMDPTFHAGSLLSLLYSFQKLTPEQLNKAVERKFAYVTLLSYQRLSKEQISSMLDIIGRGR